MADDVDFAEILARAEREKGAARAQAAVSGDGADDCSDCGKRIPAARRAAAPFAERCVRCQQDHERSNVR
jgi:phage/conjugal plasmid C-4 type zinc finger TraR family protein